MSRRSSAKPSEGGPPSQHYVGRTANVDERLAWHNVGPCGHTLQYRPWSIVVSLELLDERAAAHFEKYLKSGSGRAFVKRHLARVPEEPE